MKNNRAGYNREFAATVLLTAVYSCDEDACQKYGITTRTLQNYRRRLTSDHSLSEVFATKKAKLDEEWVEDFVAPLKQGAAVIKECFEEIRRNPRSKLNPMLIDAVSNALRTCADIALTAKAINAQFSHPDQPADQLPQEVPSPIQVEYPC